MAHLWHHDEYTYKLLGSRVSSVVTGVPYLPCNAGLSDVTYLKKIELHVIFTLKDTSNVFF